MCCQDYILSGSTFSWWAAILNGNKSTKVIIPNSDAQFMSEQSNKKSVGIMNECKSVCIIQNSIKTVVVFRLSYIKQLLSRGHKVYCIAPNDDNESVDCLKKYGVIVITTDNERLLYRYFLLTYHCCGFYSKRSLN